MACRKGLNLRRVSLVAIVILTAFGVYYFSTSIQVTTSIQATETGIATRKGDRHQVQASSTEKHLPYISPWRSNNFPTTVNSIGKHPPFIVTGRDDQPLSHTKITETNLDPLNQAVRGDKPPSQLNSTRTHLPFVLTGSADQSPSQTNSTGKYFLSFSSQGRGDQPQSLVNSAGKYGPLIPSGINNQQPSRVNSTGKDVHFIPISRHDQDHQSAPHNTSTPAKLDYRQRFLDYAKEDLLHMIPPTYLPQFKNPCWYEHSTDKIPTLRCLPYFMILGQNKCGTTDLYMNVVKHPDVIAAKGKEPQFWARIRHCYYNRPWTWTNYIDYFNPTAKKIQKILISNKQTKVNHSAEIITGEATPSNLWDNRWWWNYKVNQNDTEPPSVTNADYLHRFMPNLKMVIILRNPVSRLYSDYKYVSVGKISPELFHQEVVNEIDSFRNCSRLHDFRYCVFRNSFDERNVTSTARLQNGFYALFIEEYLKFYPREQFHIIRLEDYSKQKTEVMNGIFRFLKLRVPEKRKKPDKRRSKVSKIGDMLLETKTLITEFYKPYTEHLADLLKDERFLWRD